jgi:hypothetical protein
MIIKLVKVFVGLFTAKIAQSQSRSNRSHLLKVKPKA